MDSLIADSVFTGARSLNLSDGIYDINIERGFEVRVDTTFSEPENIRVTKLDTIYTVGLSNIDSGGIDTIFVNRSNLDYYKSQSNFYAIFNQDTSSRSELITDYLRMKYHLSNDLLYCPITNEKYIFEIDSTGNENLTFTDGINTDYTSTNGELGINYAELNEGRLPYYHRLDASISKKIILNKKIKLDVTASVTNVYNRQNIFYFNRIKHERVDQLPIMPSIGINIMF